MRGHTGALWWCTGGCVELKWWFTDVMLILLVKLVVAVVGCGGAL